nr:hypothetical protein PJ912_23895 [Pectobacterium colocasium]
MLQLHCERWTSNLPHPLPELDNVFCQQAYRQMIDKVESAIDSDQIVQCGYSRCACWWWQYFTA